MLGNIDKLKLIGDVDRCFCAIAAALASRYLKRGLVVYAPYPLETFLISVP